MLTIRTHQIERLDAHFQERLIERIRQHVAMHLPDDYAQQLATDPHSTSIRQSLDAARRYGLTTDANLTIFTDFRLVYGPDFPLNSEWAIEILTDGSLHEDEKTEQLRNQLDTYLTDAKPKP
ncbi:hypothetical protein FAES_5214 [Fibrella aestuarina BUZ 2]|uniref:Uncharacterized protein n=1 Tax=Fibrella aestuarina BUZ 2 TaxID=1166018 RepID=I0KGG0_9BACT|nr:hypothetical protein [Fibrella aestuarina]CCH03213.1 hypothetical protein FAES_5214 [Fibrella aestuarina BUZ 2]